MRTQTFTTDIFQTNCYVAFCEKPNEENEAESVFKFIENSNLEPRYVVNTDGHPDYTCGNGLTKVRYHVSILIHEYDACILGKQDR